MLNNNCFALDQTRFVVAEFSQLSGFTHVPLGGPDEYRHFAPELVSLGKEWKTRYPKIRAVILESIEAPPYADLLRSELEIPVFDTITICDLFTSASWDGQRSSEQRTLSERDSSVL